MLINLDSFVQLAADVVADYLASEQVLKKFVGVDGRFDPVSSFTFHALDELVLPIFIEKAPELLEKLPFVGEKLSELFRKMACEDYVKVVLRIVMIGMVQKALGGIDFISGGVMLVSSYAIDFAAEMDAVKNVLDISWDIGF